MAPPVATSVGIPAVCRIPDRGTAVLIAPGVLLTSIAAVGSKQEAGTMSANFFEMGKLDTVVARLKPSVLFFSSMFPEHLDYCLIACDSKEIYNVECTHVPTVLEKCPTVNEGETVLVLHHPFDATADVETEIKKFLKVGECTSETFHLPVQPEYSCAGCPVFNSQGELVGIQTQVKNGTTGKLESRAIRISAILKHMFANGILTHLDNKADFQSLWNSWVVPEDSTSVIQLMRNFPAKDIRRQTFQQLCDLTKKGTAVESLVGSGALDVLLENLKSYQDELVQSEVGLHALWNLAVGNEECTRHILESDGLELVLSLMERFRESSEVNEYGSVLVFNMLTDSTFSLTREPGERIINAVSGAMKEHAEKNSEVIVKFGCGNLSRLCELDSGLIPTILRLGVVELVVGALGHRSGNEFFCEKAVGFLQQCSRSTEFIASSHARPVIKALVDTMKSFPSNDTLCKMGNHALWQMGLNPNSRLFIIESGGMDIIAASMASAANDPCPTMA